ncbi:Nif3-like dinuclear metal center hexameric protein [Tomitella biformata]|uniref:Nif3-like dinuclear metal center hexameric protein n=1 Tax=Tomitella biformata TaxID=630403 RepID=UPI0004B13F03|nr:Nif3-like dinuclear metal center hexameric protein [Tomitella biformata]
MTGPEISAPVTLAEIIAVLDAAYPPALAESWDSVGLVCGDPGETVSSVLIGVDPTAGVVDEAIGAGAQLLIAHHPLLLRGVDTVGAHTPKGALVHKLIRAQCALFTAHTNADSADPGVSDALAGALGLTALRPIAPKPQAPVDKWAVLVPTASADAVRQAMFAAGAGQIETYDQCSWSVPGTGQFRPLDGANPALGQVGELETVAEERIELLAPRGLREQVLAALRAAHPYEVPAFDALEVAELASALGLGRVGELPAPMTLAEFTAHVGRALPATEWGVRAAGDPDRVIRTVAVCGGSGDSYLGAVTRLGVDAYVTADLRHHPADEHLRAGGPALVDVAHWASEQPWCAQARDILRAAFGDRITVAVAQTRTDPWTVAHH